jgi:hypothetical protein
MPGLQPGIHRLYVSVSDKSEAAKTSNSSLNFIYLNSSESNSGFASHWYSGPTVPNDDDAFSGDYYLDTSNGDVYQKNGNIWQLAMNITGPQGAPGVAGVAGVQGPTGPQGLQGEKGDAGAQGDTGQPGAQGMPGAPGLTGPQGVGIQGPQGLQGETGPQGTAGSAAGGAATNIYNGRINLQNLAASVLPNGWSVSQVQAGIFKAMVPWASKVPMAVQ